jgi:TPR repeat protein
VEQLEELGRAYYEGLTEDDGESYGSVEVEESKMEIKAIKVNRVKAFEVWTEASTRGSIESTYSLAVCLREGVGCNKDPTRAFELMETLADKHNYYLAHFALGVMLQNAEGTHRDDSRAFKHFKAAGKAGLLPSLQHIAHCYADGKGVKQSDKNAALYYEAAVEAGDVFAKYTLATWIYKGRGGLTVDKERAFRLQQEAASAGHPAAMFNVGAHYMSGEGVDRDIIKAMEWFDKASLAGMVPATLNLAKMYFEGAANGGVRNKVKAKEILSRDAHRSDECKAALMELEAEP